jgi:hypothetical protein
MPKYLHFGSVSWLVMTVWRYFLDNFWSKSGQIKNIISRKQIIWHRQNFNHWFLTCQSVFLQIFKKIKNETLFFFGLEHCRKNEYLVTLWIFCQILHGKPFPKCSKTCILVQWMESYDHLNIFRRLFLVQNTIFSKISKNCKKLKKAEYKFDRYYIFWVKLEKIIRSTTKK